MVSMQWFQKISTQKFVTYVAVSLVTLSLKDHEEAKNKNCVVNVFLEKIALGPPFSDRNKISEILLAS